MADIATLRRHIGFRILKALTDLGVLVWIIWFGWAVATGRVVVTITGDAEYVCSVQEPAKGASDG